MREREDSARGLTWVTLAYVFLGLTPIFWKSLRGVSPFVLLEHRVVWALVFLSPLLFLRGRREEIVAFLRSGGRARLLLPLSAGLMAGNWYFYVVATVSGHVLDCSLAYFLVPLVSVVLGVLFYREAITPLQWTAVAVAGLAVLLFAIHLGRLPFLVVVLCGAQTLYGFFKKRLPLSGVTSVALEAALLSPLMLWLLVRGHALHFSPRAWMLVVLTGPVTALPLVWFAIALPRIRFVSVGVLFYLTPAIQFLLGAFVYHEPLDGVGRLTFALIGGAVILFVIALLREPQRKTATTDCEDPAWYLCDPSRQMGYDRHHALRQALKPILSEAGSSEPVRALLKAPRPHAKPRRERPSRACRARSSAEGLCKSAPPRPRSSR